jgi:hypothetical protein
MEMPTEERKLLENGNVQQIITKELPRYKGYENYSQAECEMVVEDFKENCKIWTTKHSREGFEMLDTKENWEPEGESLSEDLDSYQKYLDDTYGTGKYEAYTIGAYIHSAVSFAFGKSEDRRCQWDSGTIGFIGIPVEWKELGKQAQILSDAWNGYISVLEVVDNLTEETVDEIYSTEGWNTIQEWKEDVKEKYGVTECKTNY